MKKIIGFSLPERNFSEEQKQSANEQRIKQLSDEIIEIGDRDSRVTLNMAYRMIDGATLGPEEQAIFNSLSDRDEIQKKLDELRKLFKPSSV